MKDTLIEALNLAGAYLSEHLSKRRAYKLKHNNANIVTEADIQAEEIILSLIKSCFPEHNIVAEESGYVNHASTYTWIVDPLDGTSNYATGLPWFGVLICLLKGNQPYLAGAYLPYYKMLYLAEQGKGCFMNDERVLVTDEKELKNILLAYGLDYSEDNVKLHREIRIMEALIAKVRNFRTVNSLIDFCYTADGRLGACLNQTTKIWDIAAPSLLLSEAGAKVTDFNGKPLDFSLSETNWMRNFEMIAANENLHDQIMEVLLTLRYKH
jgi:myo-inositol-1(or 4)-monophosphatase